MNPHLPPRASPTDSFEYYRFHPSLPAAVTFVALFALATGLHLFQMIRVRTWFMIPFVIGCGLEAIGYVFRIVSSTEAPGPYSLAPYLLQAVLILIAPTLFAASIYMELGRIVLMIDGERALFVRRKWLTKIFVTGDIIAFGIQSSGGSLLSSDTPSTVDIGNIIVIVGLFAQIIFFGLFIGAATIFHVKMGKAQTQLARERPWTKHMISLYIVSALIFIRSIIRVVEYVQGEDGYIMTHEVFIYVCDAALMFAAVVTMSVIHPGQVAKYVRAMESDEYRKCESRESRRNMLEMS
ncbi:uncharacterized protein LTR77_010343 [Saxophila tyrrhenica]|uniref:RTA1-domain-containing protein n=1 Tax=Saxophila tyrrhenica TaxID=1690608 RepID=A0AAV9NZK7_9PEZI|nr:hypothetical protein LTR77_010343 [Saxophila tyrrhenica]